MLQELGSPMTYSYVWTTDPSRFPGHTRAQKDNPNNQQSSGDKATYSEPTFLLRGSLKIKTLPSPGARTPAAHSHPPGKEQRLQEEDNKDRCLTVLGALARKFGGR